LRKVIWGAMNNQRDQQQHNTGREIDKETKED